MKNQLVGVALAMVSLGVSIGSQGIAIVTPAPAHAQTNLRIEGVDLGRAKNLARQAIEELNGGLGAYRAEPAMHGPARQSPYVENGDGSWTFTFQGRVPGSSVYTVESVVTVTDGGEVEVDYNGPIRAISQTPTRPTTPSADPVVRDRLAQIDLSRAKNLARQAAETENGGLGRYRAEPDMHGPVTDAPYVTNPDGSWTFTFQGGAPGSSVYTVESVVTVTPAGEITIDYNGPIR